VVEDRRRLESRKALVLGAGTAAGRAIAVALAEAGADVAVASSSLDGEEVMACRRTRRAVEAAGRRSAEYAFDVTLGQNVQVSTRQVAKEMGGLDILVYAVQNAPERPTEKITDAEWSRALAFNLSGAFFACRAALREMLGAGGGRIILVAGNLADTRPGDAMLLTARHGLVGLARAVAVEYADRGIRANVLGAYEPPAGGHRGTDILPTEIGPLAAYLASDASAGISGQVLPVHGPA
jgi:NAD(P)-dependent dehydrogenase (short-subunit alcohol dehydrogenase family)